MPCMHGKPGWAQSDTSAQEYQRQQERERQLRQQQEQRPDVRLPEASSKDATGRKLTVFYQDISLGICLVPNQ